MDYRLYYNKASEAPYIWSIDTGSQKTEINVIDVVIHQVRRVETHFDPTIQRTNQDVPAAWIIIHDAVLHLDSHRIAHFFHDL